MDFFIQLFTDPLGFYSAHQLLISQVGINALLTLSMYITLNCGMLTLANVGFMAVGAYISVLLGLNTSVPFPAAMLIGGLAATLLAVPIGLPVLRLSGIFLAIATIGFGQVVVGVILNVPATGEGQGLINIEASPATAINYIFGGLVVVAFVLWRLRGTRLGQAWAAIREDEVAAEAHGINVARYRLIAFVLGAFVAGCAGGLDAHLNFIIAPSEYQFTRVVGVLVFAVAGGFTNVVGPIIGATVLTSLPEILRFARDYRDLINGVVLILVILFLPRGIAGGRRPGGRGRLMALWRWPRSGPATS
ncbi:MAG TPA: branched-chain amino acid ABC transporter permease [Candidatus Dormibacteraeota bacterium]|nr:branched-chain amino acid ABC transporter permease [Candidatus Dormibacteraeota bacterium]